MPSRKKLIVVTAVLAFALLVAGLVVLYKGETLSVPQSLANCGPVVSVIKGEEAVEEINKLHWSGNVGITDGIVSKYACGARLWVSVSKEDAKKLVNMMANVIIVHSSQGRLPLEFLGRRMIGECTVYLVADVSGQIHAFWGKDHIEVWVETATPDLHRALDIVKEVAQYYKCT